MATDASLTADPGVASSIPARSHTFVEIDHKIISTVIFTLSNPAVGETVLTPVKWCCNTGEVPIRIKKSMDEQTSGKKSLFSLILYKRLQ